MATATIQFDEQKHLYVADGLVIPSVTQVLKAAGLISFAGINPQVLERKRRLGSLVHKAAQLLDEGSDLGDFEIPVEVYEYLDGYMTFCNDCKFVPTLIERRMLGNISNMRYGMTPDRTGPIDGIPYVIELKCGAAQHPAWQVQLAGYDMGLPKPLTHRRHARAALQLGKQFPRGYKLYPYEDEVAYTVWMGALANTIWMQNVGLFITEEVPERLVA